ncbi:NAD(P)-binding protein [Macrolepiota fuliginosa MF-IS2]|uniref:NAD(P)-binding protein n=1 Tax=Macrolepiota fuliginosa MF-IS2 TaxID=1400762 RepID=A0A9P5XP95_9AGAR|nr:NAD(P)-binding protein [Macrolepiota fuliginosa MF-IS2]
MGLFISTRRTILEEDLGDLHGKVVVVTGGNSGIGFPTVQVLARKGAKVYMASRSEERSKEAIAQLENAGLGDGSVHWLKLDLSDPRYAKSAAQELLEKETRLDILINNAAKAIGPYALGRDGIQEHMVTNYLSHFIFTENLLPLMARTSKEEGSDVRIINLTSTAHEGVAPATYSGKESWNYNYGDTQVGRVRCYGLSKVANILHVKNLQQRLDAEEVDIICIAVDPGAVGTENVARWLEGMTYLFWIIVWIFTKVAFSPPGKGAMNSLYAAASPEVKASAKTFKGAHLLPVGKITKPSKYAADERLAKELYDTTLDVLEEINL